MALTDVGVRAVIDNLPGFLSGAGRMDDALGAVGSTGTRAGQQIAGGAAHAEGALGKLRGATGGVLDLLGKVGLASLGFQAVTSAARGAGEALGIGLNAELETTRAQLVAFTKDGAQADKILADIRQEASTTPFAFQEMAKATASLLPASKQSGVALMDLVRQAEILAASNPAEGLEGAAFALKEALSGDFVSIIERFNLPRQRLNELKEQGVPALQAVQTAMREMGLDADLVSGLANTATGRWSTLMDTFDTLRASLGKPLFDVLSASLAKLQPLLDANMGALSGMASGVGDFLGALASGAIDALVRFAAGAKQLWEAAQPVRDVLQSLASVVQSFVLPALRDLTKGDYVSAFQGLGSAANIAGVLIQDGLKKAVDWVRDNAPLLIGRLQAWASGLVEWVGPQVPVLLNKLQDLREAALDWVIAQVPGWINALGQWAAQFTAWIAPQINPMLEELLKLAGRMLDWIAENAPEIVRQFTAEWAPAAVLWVAEAAGNLLKELPSILLTIVKWSIENTPKVLATFINVGRALVEGILSGLAGMVPVLLDRLGTLAGEMLQTVKDRLGIKSPSQEFRRLGALSAEGYTEGILSGVQAAAEAATALVTAAWDRAAAVNDARMAAEEAKLAQITSAQFNDILRSESANQQAAARLAWERGAPARAAELSLARAQAEAGRQRQFSGDLDRLSKFVSTFAPERYEKALAFAGGTSLLTDVLGQIAATLPPTLQIGNVRLGNLLPRLGIPVRLPQFADGVMNFAGGMALVGERGPEVVMLPPGASVLPNQSITNNYTVNASYAHEQSPASVRTDLEALIMLARR